MIGKLSTAMRKLSQVLTREQTYLLESQIPVSKTAAVNIFMACIVLPTTVVAVMTAIVFFIRSLA